MTATQLEVHPTLGQATSKPIPHGTNTGYKYHGCRCIHCADAAAAYQLRRRRRQGAGVWNPLVDAADARAHIETLRKQGMAYEQIARQARITLAHLNLIRSGSPTRQRIERIRPETAARILAVRYKVEQLTEKAHVPSRGAIRRIQALRAHGWTVGVIAERVGVDKRTIVAIPRQEVLYATTHQAICLVYEDLLDQDPARHGITRWVRDRARREARAAGFAPPSAWDDIDADGQPAPRIEWRVQYTRASGPERRQALVEDTAELAALGVPRDLIAERLGVTWSAITQAHSRCGVPLPEIAA